ncbi:DNA-3-methyladenine glycosylase 1 isoform X2 [Medicago truncatula]|uniref:DNA-3-methyladenine glycosylase I n=1 Tax=Medicago truncatula TaxID=3880 RepID=I3T727_MEDTR|nr:DNA-3-methyladenine glycosylase 1 isoform X2 [Medicago truncatula]AFK48319.1 unknown [Medicago truncatula]KEH17530.1 DNA-3-methyladenine glycosylase I [Medicago truncatula]
MSKVNAKRHAMEKKSSDQESKKLNQIIFHKHLKRVYPIGLQKSSSSSSISSFSSSLSQNSNDPCFTDSLTIADEEVSLALHSISPRQRREHTLINISQQQQNQHAAELGELKRCSWITKNYKAYIEFHDECWGVPAYDDKKLFELLALSGLLIDYNWTEILKRKEVLRQVFAGFDPYTVSKMEEKEVIDIASATELVLAECRVKCIVDNAKCMMKIRREFGSFSSYIWSYVNHKPVINKYRYSRDVPLRTPKADAISKDLLKRGFRYLGPVIVYSFMQVAGLTIDHLVGCYRHKECVNLAERPWKHI